ncbi:MAG: hypothetical protein GMKNLPBB_01250 [Myxococcota bacterium]|nr:hypothetical protein [Myxococcota bacterium]
MSGLIESLIRNQRVIVCCGAGGVGKTTTSAALAVAAARLGRRVLVVTIDPSRRLAETLGVSRNTPQPAPLPEDRLAEAGIAAPGLLDAWMLDPQIVSDASVRRLTNSEEDARKFMENRIYRQISNMIAGMQEYTAMEALYNFIQDNSYDLVVLDTPPSRNALAFLEAPAKLAGFIDGRVFKLFAVSEQSGWGVPSRFINSIFGMVFGDQLASELQGTLGMFSQIMQSLNMDVTKMREFLSKPECAFLLVTSPAQAALAEAEFFHAKTREMNLPFRGFILNRSQAVVGERRMPTDDLLPPGAPPELVSAWRKLQPLAERELEEVRLHQGLVEKLRKEAGGNAATLALPSLPEGVDDMRGLLMISQALMNLEK